MKNIAKLATILVLSGFAATAIADDRVPTSVYGESQESSRYTCNPIMEARFGGKASKLDSIVTRGDGFSVLIDGKEVLDWTQPNGDPNACSSVDVVNKNGTIFWTSSERYAIATKNPDGSYSVTDAGPLGCSGIEKDMKLGILRYKPKNSAGVDVIVVGKRIGKTAFCSIKRSNNADPRIGQTGPEYR